MRAVPTGSRRYIALAIGVIFCLVWLSSSSTSVRPRRSAAAPLVMVLAANTASTADKKAAAYLQRVIDNRKEYATKHGYQFVLKHLQHYNLQDVSTNHDSWARILALREVLDEHPDSEWFWYLDQDAIIMETDVSLTEQILTKEKLETLALQDVPIVPPDSVIRTMKPVVAESAQLVLSQDHSGLNTKSFILRNGEFARYFLEIWSEPLYRSYGFDHQEVSALEHIVQWHYSVLSKIVLLPKRVLASYNSAPEEMNYKKGDFVVVLDGCKDTGRSCEMEFDRLAATRDRAGTVAPVEGQALPGKAHG